MALADPLITLLCVEQVLGVQLDALVVLHVRLELLVADHGVAEEAILVTTLLHLIVDQLVHEVVLDSLVQLFNLNVSFVLDRFMSGWVLIFMVPIIVVMMVVIVVVIVMDIMVDIMVGVVVDWRLIIVVIVGTEGESLINMVHWLDLFCKLRMLKEVVDGGVRFGQNLRLCQVVLESLDIVNIARVVLTHVLFEGS